MCTLLIIMCTKHIFHPNEVRSSQNFQLSTSSLKSILGGRWWFLTRDLEDGVFLDIMDCHDTWFLTCVPNFNSLAWLEVCQGPPILEVHTWRTLTVPDRRLGGFGHLWWLRSSWQTRMKLSWKFHKNLTSFGWEITAKIKTHKIFPFCADFVRFFSGKV